MAKRLFSTDKRAETILSNLRERGENLSGFICASVVDEVLPVYSQLRIEALYLLDVITDGAKDWKGKKLMIGTEDGFIDSRQDVDFVTRETVGRGVSWLARNHHIKKADVLREVVGHYHESSWNGGVSLEAVNENVKAEVIRVREKLKEIDPNYNDFRLGLGSLARDVLEHWDELWDWDDSYNIIVSVVYNENPIGRIEPMKAIKILQWMENQFIIEAIKERTK